MSDEIQSVLFDKEFDWDYDEAMGWLHNHGFDPIDEEETEDFLHFTLIEPRDCSNIRTGDWGDGIEVHYCFCEMTQ